MDSFAHMHLAAPIAQALTEAGYVTPTAIQAQAIPKILAGKDVIGIAQTGTGKTAAFVIPILQHLLKHPKTAQRGYPRALILAPTRELANQISENIATYGKHVAVVHTTIYGGVSQGPQVHLLSKPLDILVATPGRLIDLMRQGFVKLGSVELLVLDEADRMLDMGFADDLRILAAELPQERQTLLFSATMGTKVAALTHNFQRTPERIAITEEATTVGAIAQHVLYVDKEDKPKLLLRIIETENVKRAIVFVAMKHVADRLVARLAAANIIAEALHSDKTQAMRAQTMADFKSGKTRILVATDIAARGIDVDGITHVINYELPKDPETYVHRIGRTARAGTKGIAFTFCSGEELTQLHAVQKLIKMKLHQKEHKYHSVFAFNGGVMSNVKKPTIPGVKTGRGGGKTNSNHAARKSSKWKQK